ncbi:hypothetical protein [Pelagibius sp. Alg239-R121]|uniref:hypothetical protein n=1 Tax=Pelagibius sp. Alg239-R121 TaxID=2993448 RepID=UPI0024A78E5C|nr:hypothetical protein [Pelagibius sp. Alg239-R121]
MSATLNGQLEALADKGGRAQSEHPSLDWEGMPPKLTSWRRGMAIGIVNQFIGGEEATARLCRDLAPRICLASARDCLLIQVEDEMNHAAIYRRYLNRIGGRASAHHFLEEVVKRSLSWKGAPEAALLAFHVIVEGEALAFLDEARDWIQDPLFHNLSRQIARDEARHVAFGRLYLSQTLPCLPLQERIEIYRWLRALWFDGTTRLTKGRLGSVIATALPHSWMQKRWDHWILALQPTGLFDGATLSEFS